MSDTADPRIEAACEAFYYEWGDDVVDPGDAAMCRSEMRNALAAADAVDPIRVAARLPHWGDERDDDPWWQGYFAGQASECGECGPVSIDLDAARLALTEIDQLHQPRRIPISGGTTNAPTFTLTCNHCHVTVPLWPCPTARAIQNWKGNT